MTGIKGEELTSFSMGFAILSNLNIETSVNCQLPTMTCETVSRER